jgi:hypothetical protein
MRLPALKDTKFWSDLLAVAIWGAVKAWRILSG